MILKRLNIIRLPGIDESFQVDFKGSGFHIIHGPNGIGKSSLCKAVEHLYWGDSKTNSPISVTGHIELNGVNWSIERDGRSLKWSRIDGLETDLPELPPSYQAKCFFLQLRDLIDPSKDSLADIATQINRQMAGGFDLDAVIESFPELTRHRTGKLSRDFIHANSNIDKKQKEQSHLQSRENHLETLQKKLESAREEANREASIDRALGLLEKRKELDQLRPDLSRFPSEISKLQGNEIDRLNGLEERIQNLSEEIKQLIFEVQIAEDEQHDSQLSAPLDSINLTAKKSQVDKLIRLEDKIQTIDSEIAGDENGLSKAMKAIGGTVRLDRQYTLEEHGQLYEFLGQCTSAQNQQEIINTKIKLLETDSLDPISGSNSNEYESAITALRMWLRAPVPGTSFLTKTNAIWGLLVGLITSLLGGILTVYFSLTALILVGTGLSILLFAFFVFLSTHDSPSTSDTQEAAENDYRQTSQPEPEPWEFLSVKHLLTQLETEQAKALAKIQLKEWRKVELAQLKLELETVRDEQEKLDIKRLELAKELNLEHVPDAKLVDYARSLNEIQEIHNRLNERKGTSQELKASYAKELEIIRNYISEYGTDQPQNGFEAKAIIDSLGVRSNQLEKAISKKRSAEKQIERRNSEKQQEEKHVQDIYASLSIEQGDFAKLRDMLNQQQEYLELGKRISKLENLIDGDMQELHAANQSDLENLTIEDLQQLKKQAEQAKHRVEEISKEISEIQTLTNQAKQGSTMQDLITEQENARMNLQDALDVQLQSQAVKFLISQVKEQYEQRHVPRLFERAKFQFQRFTHNSYDLQIARHDGKPALRAMDLHAGKIRELDQLSDGTRVQLLIAARIAYAEEIEKNLKLPFFLDEALDQSDPQRFAAIVKCLGQASADQKRQIVYLTSDPSDQNRINHALEHAGYEVASIIDLGGIRNRSVRVDDATKLEVQSEADIPAPSSQPYSQYVFDLAIPEFIPTRGWNSQSICYVLPENNELLYRFFKNGIRTAGQWSIVQGQPLANELCSELLNPEEIGNRVELFKVFCELWSVGRGRPLDRHALETSEAISDRYIQGISDIAKENQGSASKVLEILRGREDERSSSFRHNQIEKLEQYFLDNGYLEEREILDKDGLLLRIRATPVASKLSEDASLTLIRKWQALADRFS